MQSHNNDISYSETSSSWFNIQKLAIFFFIFSIIGFTAGSLLFIYNRYILVSINDLSADKKHLLSTIGALNMFVTLFFVLIQSSIFASTNFIFSKIFTTETIYPRKYNILSFISLVIMLLGFVCWISFLLVALIYSSEINFFYPAIISIFLLVTSGIIASLNIIFVLLHSILKYKINFIALLVSLFMIFNILMNLFFAAASIIILNSIYFI